MNSTTLVGVLLVAIGLVLMYIGLYGWTGAPQLSFETFSLPQNAPAGP